MMPTALVIGTGNERVWPRAFTDASSKTISNFEKHKRVYVCVCVCIYIYIYIYIFQNFR